jgi:hypothetical protein
MSSLRVGRNAAAFVFALVSALALGSSAWADPPEGEGKTKPLTSKELSGTWQGEKDGVKIGIAFSGADDATWTVNTGTANIGASLKRVDDKNSGTVHLRLDYVETATSKKESAVLGRVERDKSGALRVAVLPAATKITADYKPVESVLLTEVKDKKP